MFAAISGFVSGALEGDMFKRISFVMELNPGATMSFISFWAILAIFLASAVVRRWRRLSLVHIKIAFAAGLVYFLITSSFIDEIMFAVDAGFDVLAGPYAQQRIALLVFPNNLLELLIFTGILVFLPYFCVSLMLPHVCNRIQSLDRHIGFAYGLNTVAFCIGLVAFTLVAPRVNIFYSLKLFTLLFGIAIFSVFLLRERQRIRIWQPGIFLLACVVAALITSTSFDKHFFPATTDPATHPVSALKSNGANTTFVVNVDGDRALYFGRLKMSATSLRARTYMRLMAHFPLLLHAQPETALLICFGAGNTAAALAAHESLRQIDVVDLNDKVFKTAPEFAATNDEVYLDPRVRFIHDDGRNYLNFTDQTYDLITSEPPPPLAAGVYRLYSREYYMAAKQRMTPEGLMTQWLPMHLMDPGSVELAIRTFTAVFPDTLIITGFGSDFILVGGKSSLGLTRLERRFHESARVKADLERLRIRRPADLLARVVVGDRKLRDRYSGMRVISDQHNDLEGLFRDRSRPVIIWYDPKTVLAYLTARVPQLHNELESTLMHLGRLRYRVHGFPFASLATVGFSDVAGVALGKTDWIEIAKLNDSLRFAAGAGRIEEMIGVLEKLLRVAEEQPEVLLALADLRIRAAEYPAAIIALREFQRLEPDDPVGYRLFGRALMLNGQADEAVTQFQEAQRLDPDDYVPLLRLAWILATHPDRARRQPDEALRLAKTAADLTAYRNVEVLNTLAAAYASAGQFDRAVHVGQSAIEAFDANAGVGLDNLNLHLRAYRNRQSLSDQSLAPES
jgi:cytochrome c-type biogenesis protein CcmH/NrfG